MSDTLHKTILKNWQSNPLRVKSDANLINSLINKSTHQQQDCKRTVIIFN